MFDTKKDHLSLISLKEKERRQPPLKVLEGEKKGPTNGLPFKVREGNIR